ncbi:MAG: hypothetical protein ACPGUC_00335 [Gammaproteobacteria bacterium]
MNTRLPSTSPAVQLFLAILLALALLPGAGIARAGTPTEAANALYRYHAADQREDRAAYLSLVDTSHVPAAGRTTYLERFGNLAEALWAYWDTRSFELLDAGVDGDGETALILYRLKASLVSGTGRSLMIDQPFVARLYDTGDGWRIRYAMPRAAWEQRNAALGNITGLGGNTSPGAGPGITDTSPDTPPARTDRPLNTTPVGVDCASDKQKYAMTLRAYQRAASDGGNARYAEQMRANMLKARKLLDQCEASRGTAPSDPVVPGAAPVQARSTFDLNGRWTQYGRWTKKDGSPGNSTVHYTFSQEGRSFRSPYAKGGLTGTIDGRSVEYTVRTGTYAARMKGTLSPGERIIEGRFSDNRGNAGTIRLERSEPAPKTADIPGVPESGVDMSGKWTQHGRWTKKDGSPGKSTVHYTFSQEGQSFRSPYAKGELTGTIEDRSVKYTARSGNYVATISGTLSEDGRRVDGRFTDNAGNAGTIRLERSGPPPKTPAGIYRTPPAGPATGTSPPAAQPAPRSAGKAPPCVAGTEIHHPTGKLRTCRLSADHTFIIGSTRKQVHCRSGYPATFFKDGALRACGRLREDSSFPVPTRRGHQVNCSGNGGVDFFPNTQVRGCTMAHYAILETRQHKVHCDSPGYGGVRVGFYADGMLQDCSLSRDNQVFRKANGESVTCKGGNNANFAEDGWLRGCIPVD